MSKIKSPQDKKSLSYLRDRRNDYGENAKSSRKNTPRSKALAQRSERHQQNHATRMASRAATEIELTSAELAATQARRLGFRKLADTPLGEYLRNRRLRRR